MKKNPALSNQHKEWNFNRAEFNRIPMEIQ